jgi:hypothetical protein
MWQALKIGCSGITISAVESQVLMIFPIRNLEFKICGYTRLNNVWNAKLVFKCTLISSDQVALILDGHHVRIILLHLGEPDDLNIQYKLWQQ